MTSYLAIYLIILVSVGVTIVSNLQLETRKDDSCSDHSDNCTDCVSASKLNETLVCYFCGNSCETLDHNSVFSNPKCSLTELYVGQCDLNFISLIVVISLSLLCCCFTCCMMLITICCCCCCCFQKRRSTPNPVTRPHYTRLINRDTFERQRLREEKIREIKEHYDV